MPFQPINFAGIAPQGSPGLRDLVSALSKGMSVGVQPQMQEAQINELRGRAQKNLMMSKLLGSLMGEGGQMPGGNMDGGEGGAPNNLRAAMIKAFTGIDPYLMSPQQEQSLKIQGATRQAAQKSNLTTGSSDVIREYLQDKVSMPKSYMGLFGSVSMAKDRTLAQKGDKAAAERLIQAAVAERLVPEYVGAQLQSQGIKGTVPALQHQTSAIRQGWPKASHLVTENLPPELQKEVERRHNKIIGNVNKRRTGFLESGGKRSNVNEQPKEPQRFSMSDIRHTAKQRGISEYDVVDKLAKKLGISGDEFMNLVDAEK